MIKNHSIKTVVLYSGKDLKSRALELMITHLQCVPRALPKGCTLEFIDIESSEFSLDDATAERYSKERTIVVLLISPALVAHSIANSDQLKRLVAQSGPATAHIFPIHCVAVENPERLPWSKLTWAQPDKKDTVAGANDKDSVCNDAARLLQEVVERRLKGSQLPAPELAVYAAEEDAGEVERAIEPMLKMARGLEYVFSWRILPGDRTEEFFARAAAAPKQVVFITARTIADDCIWETVLAQAPKKGQERLLVSLYACRWEGLGFEEWPRTKIVPEGDQDRATVGGKNSHALWLQAYEAIAELMCRS